VKKANGQQTNLLELKPRRSLEWETREEGLVTLIIPKFKSEFSRKWVLPNLAKPNIKVKLDSFGSFVWHRCDGATSVTNIGEEMAEKFGEPLEPLYERIGLFLSKLARGRFIELGD
jgi:hypothetical protein